MYFLYHIISLAPLATVHVCECVNVCYMIVLSCEYLTLWISNQEILFNE